MRQNLADKLSSVGRVPHFPPNLHSFCLRGQKWIVAQIRVRGSDGCTFLCGDDGVLPCILINPDPKLNDSICLFYHWNAVYEPVRRRNAPLGRGPTYLEICGHHVLLARHTAYTGVSLPSFNIFGKADTIVDLTSDSVAPATTSRSLISTSATISTSAHSVSRLYDIERQNESLPSGPRVRPHLDITGQVVALSTIFRSSTQSRSTRDKRGGTSGRRAGANVFFLVELQHRLALSSRVVVRLLFHQKQV